MQSFANHSGLAITVTHHPPGTSKWNRIEHRLFAFITQNWRGKPLLSHAVIVQLIGATTTSAGLAVHCCLDDNSYPKAIKVSDAEMAQINITPDQFHGEWQLHNLPYQILPLTRLFRPRPLADLPARECDVNSAGHFSPLRIDLAPRERLRSHGRFRRTSSSGADHGKGSIFISEASSTRGPIPLGQK